MKKLFTVLMLGLLGLLVAGSASAEQKLKFAIGEWEPYTGAALNGQGMATEIVSAACKAAGLDAEYEFAPWKRAENNVLTAASFGTFPYKEIPERLENYLFSAPLFSTNFGIATSTKNANTANFAYKGPEDLKGFKVGIIAGTDAIKIALQKAGVTVEEIPAPKQNLSKLEVGRIDFYIDDKAVLFQAIQNNYPADKQGDFVILDTPFGEKNDWKIMVSKQYPQAGELLQKINEGLTTIQGSGELQSILAKYGL